MEQHSNRANDDTSLGPQIKIRERSAISPSSFYNGQTAATLYVRCSISS